MIVLSAIVIISIVILSNYKKIDDNTVNEIRQSALYILQSQTYKTFSIEKEEYNIFKNEYTIYATSEDKKIKKKVTIDLDSKVDEYQFNKFKNILIVDW